MTSTDYLVILTVDLLTSRMSGTFKQVVTGAPGTTRSDLLAWALEQMPEEMQRGTVTFFYAEPNEFPVSPTATTAHAGGDR